MNDKPRYTSAGFAQVVGVIVVGSLALTIVMMLIMTGMSLAAPNPAWSTFGLTPLWLALILYISIAIGWALAYDKYFEFPESRHVLAIGSAISPLIFVIPNTAIFLFAPELVAVTAGDIPFVQRLFGSLAIYMALAMTAGLQIFGIAIALRYFIKLKLPL